MGELVEAIDRKMDIEGLELLNSVENFVKHAARSMVCRPIGIGDQG